MNNITTNIRQGWLCPRCQSINAPSMAQCTCSAGYKFSWTSTKTSTSDYIVYPTDTRTASGSMTIKADGTNSVFWFWDNEEDAEYDNL